VLVSQTHNTSIVWHINNHERRARVCVWGRWKSAQVTLIPIRPRNTHLFNVRSRINWDPKAWSWNEAWARWTSWWRKKNTDSDSGDARMTNAYRSGPSSCHRKCNHFYCTIKTFLSNSKAMFDFERYHYHSNNPKHVFLSGLVKCVVMSIFSSNVA